MKSLLVIFDGGIKLALLHIVRNASAQLLPLTTAAFVCGLGIPAPACTARDAFARKATFWLQSFDGLSWRRYRNPIAYWCAAVLARPFRHLGLLMWGWLWLRNPRLHRFLSIEQ
jgi:hypothetical protein